MKKITLFCALLVSAIAMAQLPPSNDLCAGATTIVDGDSLSGSTAFATTTGNPGTCDTTLTAPAVWFEFTGTGNEIIVNTNGSNYDTKLHVYTSADCVAFTCVGGNDDFNGLLSQVTFTSVLNDTYYILVSGFSSGTGDYTVNLDETIPPMAPTNDLCGDAISLACGDTDTGSTALATTTDLPETCDTTATAPGVWYSYTGTGDNVTVSLNGSNYDTKLHVYSGSCGALVCVAGDDDGGNGTQSQLDFLSAAGTEYYIYVSGFSANTGNYNIALTCAALDFVYDNGWTPADPTGNIMGQNIAVVNGTISSTGSFDAGSITVSNGATYNINHSINVAGDINNSGTFDASNGTVIMNGTQPQSINGEMTFGFLTAFNTTSISGAVEVTNVVNAFNNTITSNSGGLILKSSANQTAVAASSGAGSINGTVTVERYIPANRSFRLLTAPVNGAGSINANWQEASTTASMNPNPNPGFGTHITGGMTNDGFDATATNNPSMYLLSQEASGAEYTAVTSTNSTNLKAGEGYLILVRGDRSTDLTTNTPTGSPTILRATGTLVQTDYVVPSSDLNPGTNALADQGSSLVGNPFMAPVNMQEVLENNTNKINTQFYHIYDPTVGPNGAFVAVDVVANTNALSFGGAVVSEANRNLQPGQAAFVNTDLTEGNILDPVSMTFPVSAKIINPATTGTFFTGGSQVENLEVSRINLALYTQEEFSQDLSPRDGTVIRFNDSYDNAVNSQDAKKVSNIDESLASKAEDQSIAIQSRFTPQGSDEVPLEIMNYTSDNYVLRVKASGLSEISKYLVDDYLGTQQLLSNDIDDYISFSIDQSEPASMASDRFSIVFEEEVLATSEFNAASFTLYPNPSDNGTVFLQFGNEISNNVEVKFFNMLGQVVLASNTETMTSQTMTVNTTSLQSGVYLVEVSTNSATFTNRLIIK